MRYGEQVAAGLLPHEADDPAPEARPLRVRDAAQVVARDDRPARRRDVHAAEDPEQRGLAAARGADDRDHLARLHEQVEALERDDLEVRELVDPDEPVAGDDGAVAVAEPGAPRGVGERIRARATARVGGGASRPGPSGCGRVRHHSNLPRSAAVGATRRWSTTPSRSPTPTTTVIASRISSSGSGSSTSGMLDRRADERGEAERVRSSTNRPDARGRAERGTRRSWSARARRP